MARLESASGPALTIQTIAAALPIADESHGSTLKTLVANQADRRLLLVLDNCEHLIAACRELVDELLWSCLKLYVNDDQS